VNITNGRFKYSVLISYNI